jgi:hypothetical protein
MHHSRDRSSIFVRQECEPAWLLDSAGVGGAGQQILLEGDYEHFEEAVSFCAFNGGSTSPLYGMHAAQ